MAFTDVLAANQSPIAGMGAVVIGESGESTWQNSTD